ncbi:MAG: TetR/AcrR family transcriptional regulator [Desulfobacterales bacterium]|nr:TetR/AcrR family transcriptional regulator [Desulfobacterales bacterium]
MTEELSRPKLRREREREHRCRTILDAAETLFADQGFLKTSVDQVADAAEVSVGTVYFYFKNKETLLAKLFDESLFLLRSILGQEFETARTPVQGMEMAGKAFFDKFCTQYTRKALILFREAPSHGKKMADRRKKMSETLSTDLSQAIDRLGEEAGYSFRSPASSVVFANCILGVYEKMAFHFLTDDLRPGSRKAMAMDAVEFTVGGIRQITASGPHQAVSEAGP